MFWVTATRQWTHICDVVHGIVRNRLGYAYVVASDLEEACRL